MKELKHRVFKILSVIFSMLFVLIINTNIASAVSSNDAPVNSVPGTQTAQINQSITFNTANGNLISVSDPDAGSFDCTVTLQVSHGTLTLNSVTGLAFTVGDGTFDSCMTFTGALIDINSALNGLAYTPTTDYVGTDTLTITINDNGNTGIGGALEDTDTVSINVTSIYDSNDFTKLQTFLNQDSSVSGKTNGQVLNSSYDPDDPTTWTGVTWTASVPKKAVIVGDSSSWNNKGLADAIDLSGFTALTHVYIENNDLTAINVSGDTALVGFYCFNNDITSITLSNNTSLTYLNCYNNKLELLDTNEAANIKYLYCEDNQLTSLRIQSCSSLKELKCYNNNLSSLNLANNSAINTLYCYNNKLSNLDISHNSLLWDLNCSNNKLTSIDISANNALGALYCQGNQLTSINFGSNNTLQGFNCSNNNLTALDLSNENSLLSFNCSNNKLTQLSVSINGSELKLASNGYGYVALERKIISPVVFTVTAKASAPTGSSFINWTSGESEVSTLADYSLSDGTDYYIVANFTGRCVTFDIKGGTNVDGIVAEVGNKVTAPTAPTKDGYTFTGWYKESALENEWDFDNDTVTSDVTLYAKWTEVVIDPEPTETIVPSPEPTNNSSTTIPKTSENSLFWYGIGIALICAGAVFLLIAKKKRREKKK